jgi:NAD(P)-dependent dehydrogenase (short-subunit alcohol dehydrogenase family)
MGHQLLDLKDRTGVVAGGTSGIGLTLAMGLAIAGANVVATGRRDELVRKVTGDIEALRRESLAVTCDVMDGNTIDQLLNVVCKKFGGVQILRNCAGTIKRTPTLEVTDQEWNGIHRDATNLPRIRTAHGGAEVRLDH